MSATIYVEGGGSVAADRECRAGFKRLWERCGFEGRLPRMFPSGGRDSAYQDFKNHVSVSNDQEFVGLLVDSEDPITDVERTWDHLRQRDGWSRPEGATHNQVFFMTTCMETWIVADRNALRNRFARDFNENRLPPMVDLERRSRDDVFARLRRATNDRYSKGAISFGLLGSLNPNTLEQHLLSFRRARRILNEKLGS